MLIIESRIGYDLDRRRTLKFTGRGPSNHRFSTNDYTLQFSFNPKEPPSVAAAWCWCWNSNYPEAHVKYVNVLVHPHDALTGRPSLRVSYVFANDRDHKWIFVDPPPAFPGDPETWVRLPSIARQVAANRAPAEAIVGFIEDNMSEPWNALATDNPLALFRTLCPIPLAANKDCT